MDIPCFELPLPLGWCVGYYITTFRQTDFKRVDAQDLLAESLVNRCAFKIAQSTNWTQDFEQNAPA